MTRKRYVKLLVACGYTRNLAQARAASDLFKYGRYARAFAAAALEPYQRCGDVLQNVCTRFADAWESVRPLLCRAIRNIVSAMEAAGKEGEK